MIDQKRINELRQKEQQLKAQRKALEVRASKEARRSEARTYFFVGKAVLAWAQNNDAVRAVLPDKLKPFLTSKDMTVLKMILEEMAHA